MALPDCLGDLNLTTVIRNTFDYILFVNFSVVAVAQIVRASEHLGITLLTQKRDKNPKKSTIMDRILLERHNAKYDYFSSFILENNEFQLHLKESLFD